VTRSSSTAQWLAPAGLLLLSAVPMIFGTGRLIQLASSAPVTPENARFFASPIPVALHIPSAVLFCTVGAFQFVPSIRRRWPAWHRAAGRVLAACGLIAALSGLWMSVFYPRPVGDGELLAVIRVVAGSAMLISIVLSIKAIRRRDIAEHRAWMLRGYAIGQGAGTQVFTHLPWLLLFGAPDEFTRALLMAAGWLINVAVAERLIRGRSTAAASAMVQNQRSKSARDKTQPYWHSHAAEASAVVSNVTLTPISAAAAATIAAQDGTFNLA
jgi:uncharacterized membrane protein